MTLLEDLKPHLMSMSGVDESDLLYDGNMFELKEIPTSELIHYGTGCGNCGNIAMAGTVSFLSSINVDSVFAIVVDKTQISALAVKMSLKNGKILEKLVNKNGGSLRYEECRIKGFVIFESE